MNQDQEKRSSNISGDINGRHMPEHPPKYLSFFDAIHLVIQKVDQYVNPLKGLLFVSLGLLCAIKGAMGLVGWGRYLPFGWVSHGIRDDWILLFLGLFMMAVGSYAIWRSRRSAKR